MKRTQVACLTLAMICLAALPAAQLAAQQDGAQDAAAQATKSESDAGSEQQGEEKAEVRMLKVFRLKHRTAREMAQVLMMQFSPAQASGGTSPGFQGTAPFAGTTDTTALTRTLSPAATPATYGTGEAGQASQDLSVAFVEDKNLLFVRATADRLSQVEELVTALDSESTNVKPFTFGEMRFIPIDAEAGRAAQTTLSQLQLPGQLVQLGEVSMIVVRADKEGPEAEQVDQVIQQFTSGDEEATEDPASEEAPKQNRR